MPLPPFTRLLIVLTLLAFPWVFITMMEPRSWLAPGLLGIALSLWTAALFGIVKSGASFDECAFHSTRPRGRQRSFARSSVVLLGVVLGVSLMAAIRGWNYNLGWRATWAGAWIVFSLMCLFTAAVATGFNLSFNQGRATRWVGWIMVGLPLLGHIVIGEMKEKPMWPGAEVFASWTLDFSPAVMTAAALYGVAWWLAAKQERWWSGLLAGGLAGLSLVAVKGARLRDPVMPSPPLRSVALTRLPLVDAKANAGWAKGTLRTFDFIDFLHVTGLGKDEILSGQMRVPFPLEDQRIPGFRNENGFQLLTWQRSNPADSTQEDEAWILAAQLPSRPTAAAEYSNSRAKMMFDADKIAATLERMEKREWEFGGDIYRIIHHCEVPLFKGGSLPLKNLGYARILPASQTESQLSVPYRLTYPSRSFDPNWHYSAPGLATYALVVNRSGTVAAKSEPWYQTGGDGGLASTWINSTFQFAGSFSNWPAAELEGATIHLFTYEPVASVKMTLPPPGRRE